MRVIARRTLTEFCESLRGSKDYKAVKAALDAWFQEAEALVWNSPADVKNSYGNASIVGKDRVVFNIKGNDYRLIAAVQYRSGVLVIRFFGTPAEYDKVDAETV